jgi:hypothetical protein
MPNMYEGNEEMSEKWKVMCIIWTVCGVVAILTQAPAILMIPAVGTLFASNVL